MASVGERLRLIRDSKRLTLTQVAEATGISVGFLSKVERDRANISLGHLKRLTSFYDVSMMTLMDDEDGPVVTPNGKGIRFGGVNLELLTPRFGGKLEALVAYHEPKSESGVQYQHEGEEFNYVLEGELIYYLEEKVTVLRKGDSIYHRSDTPHGWKNATDQVTVVLTVVTPPSFLFESSRRGGVSGTTLLEIRDGHRG